MTDKPELSRIDNTEHLNQVFRDIKNMDFKNVRDRIFEPKSFTTVIEWFDAREKLPQKDCDVLIKSIYIGSIHAAYFFTRGFDDLIPFFERCCQKYSLDEIKYWAYLPKMELN